MEPSSLSATTKPNFYCGACGFRFSTINQLQWHRRRVHSQDHPSGLSIGPATTGLTRHTTITPIRSNSGSSRSSSSTSQASSEGSTLVSPTMAAGGFPNRQTATIFEEDDGYFNNNGGSDKRKIGVRSMSSLPGLRRSKSPNIFVGFLKGVFTMPKKHKKSSSRHNKHDGCDNSFCGGGGGGGMGLKEHKECVETFFFDMDSDAEGTKTPPQPLRKGEMRTTGFRRQSRRYSVFNCSNETLSIDNNGYRNSDNAWHHNQYNSEPSFSRLRQQQNNDGRHRNIQYSPTRLVPVQPITL
ncbi:hypothetical protein H4219_005269 [Mycoemilia scoparia]|uniref:C2H2-type domain-containing protein n=1 Tax=Mycoemilia scoparia TaxID=417184 RepID=A0A9W7ZNL7_9FUNG|nr:hypothetical protein H4219_005269 [Mycoemilia scoparia]